jgi:hypothetical protein
MNRPTATVASGPLQPDKQTSVAAAGRSGWCHERTSALLHECPDIATLIVVRWIDQGPLT